MKYYLDKIVVVEGKEDVSYLSSFVEAEYVITNGFDIPKEEIEYLNAASAYKEIIVLVDPDEAGRKIEEKLRTKINTATYLCVDIKECVRGQKDGIAECKQEEIVKVLKPYFSDKNAKKDGFLRENYDILSLSNKDFRQYLSAKYHLGKCNVKKLITRLRTLRITNQQVGDTLKEFYGNQ